MKKRDVKLQDKQGDRLRKAALRNLKDSEESEEETKLQKENIEAEDSWDEPAAAGNNQNNDKLVFKENKKPRQVKKDPELDQDFMSFDTVPENAFQEKAKDAQQKDNDEESSELETRIAKKFDKNRYPWLSKRTLKIKDIFLYLHSEILDFVEFLSQTEAEK